MVCKVELSERGWVCVGVTGLGQAVIFSSFFYKLRCVALRYIPFIIDRSLAKFNTTLLYSLLFFPC